MITNKNHRFRAGFLLPLWGLLLLLCVAGCGDQAMEELVPDPEGADGKCILMLRTGIIEQSRAASEMPAKEMMHTLRIIIVRPDGTVEHNKRMDLGEPSASCYRLFKVEPDEKKTIYLIANEEGANENLTAALDAFSEATINNLSFTLKKDEDNAPLPMSAVYEVDVPAKTELVEKEMYVVRAATRISYRFVNYRQSDVTVNSIDINRTASGMYLLPHVNEPDRVKDFDGESLPWIEWLKKVADESQVNLEYPLPADDGHDPALAAKRGWITHYDVPSGVSHQSQTLLMGLTLPKEMKETADPIRSREYYMHESQYASDTQYEQHYTMTFHLTEHLSETETKEVTLTEEFKNLKALFRNTHVLVDVEIASEVVIRVIPYAECWLNPVFGLDVNKQTTETE